MIPVVAIVRFRVRRRSGSTFWLWLPVPLVVIWLLLLPFAIVLLPVFVIACLSARLRPLRTLAVLWAVMSALTGTEIALEHREASFRFRLI